MSVSILLDHTVRWQGEGPKAKRIVEAPAPEKLKVIKELVAGVVGLQTDRGDQLIVESLPFESTLNQEAPMTAAPVSLPPAFEYPKWFPPFLKQPNGMLYLGMAGAALVLVFFGGLMALFRKKKPVVAVTAAETKALADAAPEHVQIADLKQQLEAKLAENERAKEQQQLEALQSLQLPTVRTQKTEVLTKHLSAEAKKDPQAMAHVIRAWLAER